MSEPRRVGWPPPWWVSWATQGIATMWAAFWVGVLDWTPLTLVMVGLASTLIGSVRWWFANHQVDVHRREWVEVE